MAPMEHIPVADPGTLIASRKDAIEAAIREVMDSGCYVLGRQVEAFEAEFAAYLGVSDCIGVASGTDALRLALMAHDVGPGDEVITSTHTSVATVAAIGQTGARAVLVDIDATSRCIDPQRVEAAITPHTRALIAVHIHGQAAAMDALVRACSTHGLMLIEDCAQAVGTRYHGRPVGGLGDAGAFSFYPTKNLPALGDGGALVTSDADLARRVRRLRQYGWDQAQVSLEPGINSRLDEIQAAVLRVNLRHLERDNAQRRSIAAIYSQALAGSRIDRPITQNDSLHAMHHYVIELDQRDALRGFLARRGIQTALHYPLAIHQQPAYAIAGGDQLFPTATRLYRRMLTLPLYPTLSDDAVARVCDALQAGCRQLGDNPVER